MDGTAVEWSEIDTQLVDADIVVTATGATTPILRALEACAVWVGLYGGVQVIAKHVLLVGRVGEAVTAAVVPVELEA